MRKINILNEDLVVKSHNIRYACKTLKTRTYLDKLIIKNNNLLVECIITSIGVGSRMY